MYELLSKSAISADPEILEQRQVTKITEEGGILE